MPAKSRKSVVTAIESVESADSPAIAEIAATAAIPTAYAPLSLESLADLGRENLAAVTKANLALSEGIQAMSQEILSYARSSFETASHTATALLGAKTLDEVIQLNSDLAKANIETMLARSAKLSEMGVSLASEALAPLEGRVEATFAKFAKPLAA